MQYEKPGKHGLRCLVTKSSGKFPAAKKVSVMSPDVEIDGPLLTEKDEQFIEHIQRVTNRDRIVVDWFFLSHTLRGKDCKQFRSFINAGQKICAKPESLYAMAKIPEIAQSVDMVMVPAGDLRQAVGRDLPYWEKQIIEQSRAANKQVRITVATGRATSMLNGGELSQGEENGLWRAWELGADGVMDSDSFALGSNPVAVAKELRAVITAYRLRYPR
jgi:pyruvate kinase